MYEEPLRMQLNDDTLILRRVTRSSDGVETTMVGAKYVTFPIHYLRNSGLGARRENETLPTAGQQGSAAARIPLKYLYAKIGLTGQVMKLANSKPQVFVSALKHEMERVRVDAAVDLNRQVYGTGSGALAVTSSTTSLNTAVITSGIDNLQMAEVVDIYTAANLAADSTAKATARNVTAIVNNDDGTGTVTFDGAAVTFAANDVFVRTGNANREWAGLGIMVGNTGGVSYENIDPAVVPVWKSYINANGGTPRAISETMLSKQVDLTYRQCGKNVSVMVTSLGVRRSYANLLTQQRRFVKTTEFTGGFSGIAFTTDRGDIPIVADKDCPFNTIYGLREDAIKLYREADWSFMDEDGSMWLRDATKDAYTATLYQYSELATDRRNAHFKIADITES
jgi:hypothetical protein